MGAVRSLIWSLALVCVASGAVKCKFNGWEAGSAVTEDDKDSDGKLCAVCTDWELKAWTGNSANVHHFGCLVNATFCQFLADLVKKISDPLIQGISCCTDQSCQTGTDNQAMGKGGSTTEKPRDGQGSSKATNKPRVTQGVSTASNTPKDNQGSSQATNKPKDTTGASKTTAKPKDNQGQGSSVSTEKPKLDHGVTESTEKPKAGHGTSGATTTPGDKGGKKPDDQKDKGSTKQPLADNPTVKTKTATESLSLASRIAGSRPAVLCSTAALLGRIFH